jgi:hypothetical protein
LTIPITSPTINSASVAALRSLIAFRRIADRLPSGTLIDFTGIRSLRFENLEEAQAYLDRWEERWADTRIHGTTKRQVAAMFAEEKPFLLPLPLEPFRYYQYGERIVHLDGCVEVEAASSRSWGVAPLLPRLFD